MSVQSDNKRMRLEASVLPTLQSVETWIIDRIE